MTWLDLGNGWRNLFLLSCMLQAFALGTLFAVHHLFAKKSRAACFLTGVAATPLVQYLWMLLMAIVWPNASKWVYIGVPPLAAGLLLAVMGLRRISQVRALVRRGWQFIRRLCRLDKPALACLCFALCIVILVAPVCIRFCSSMNFLDHSGDGAEYMALAERYCRNRSLSDLLEKEDPEGQFRGHSHFPSLELYMSYGLFHTGEDFGYPYDKPAVTGVGMLTLYMAAAYVALMMMLCRERKSYVLLGVVLLNLVPNLYVSVATAPRDIWRILALLLAAVFFLGLDVRENKRHLLGKTAASLLMCFTVMSAHVVCFVQLPFIVVAWVAWQWLCSLYRCDGQSGRTLLRSICVALGAAAGTLLGFAGNLWCYLRWKQFSPWRLMSTFVDAPWYEGYMAMDYRLEETTSHLSFLEDLDHILLGYASPVGVWGLVLVLVAMASFAVALAVRRSCLRSRVKAIRAAAPKDGPIAVICRSHRAVEAPVTNPLFAALLTLLTLAPMSGILDSPLYSFSGAFSGLPRYTLQWFLFACCMISTALAAVHDLWPAWFRWFKNRLPSGWLKQRLSRAGTWHSLRALPAWLCVALCLLSVVQGTRQTGYADSFYRTSRHVMESETMLLDNGFRAKFELLDVLSRQVEEDEKILITRVGYQYPLHGKGYLLTSNAIVPVMNLPLEQVAAELEKMNVVMLATEDGFWDNRYYPQSTLSEYLNTLPDQQLVEYGGMRYYLLDARLAHAARQWLVQLETHE